MTFEVVTGYYVKSFSSTVCRLRLQCEPSETSETYKYLHANGWLPVHVVNIIFILSQISTYTINGIYFQWWYIQIFNGLEMSLAKQYFVDWLASIKQKDHSFCRTEENFKPQITHVGLFN